MKLNPNLRALIVTLLFSCVFVDVVRAQTTCRAAVSFSVEREGQGPIEIFFAELKAQGADEAGTKLVLEADALKVKAKAIDRCKSQYENTAGCLQGKLLASTSAMQSASFNARKSLEEALLADCKKQQGLCKEAKLSEAKCIVAVPTLAADGKAGTDGKKDAKKEEKTKK